MLKFLRVPFGQSGDRAAVPDAVVPGGDVSYTEGYGPDYSRPKTDPLSKNIEREKMNQVFFDATAAIGELQAQGAPDFITTVLNGGSPFPYAIGAVVRWTDDEVYKSLVAANTSTPADLTKWAPLDAGMRADLANSANPAKGDALVAVKQPYASAVARTQHAKNAESVSAKDFGAAGDGVTSDDAEIAAATTEASNVTFPTGVYLLTGNYTLPRGKSWTFAQGARILVGAGAVLTILGDIVAEEDQWIFDCVDSPTNYSDPNNYRGGGAVTTTTPVILGGTFYSAGGFAGAVSVKWFGATGAGFVNPAGLGAYTAAQTLPADQFTNDTKAIRFALTAICGDYEWIDIVGSQRGATGLFFPDGVYTVDNDLFFGGVALYGRTPQSPILGCKLLQVNADKNLLVVQSAGRGGLGGGGSSSQIVNLTLGYRFTTWQSAKMLGTIYFVENKFNLDTYITGCRFNNTGYQQQAIFWNQKEARAASSTNITNGTPQYGYGTEAGLQVTMHINKCMFDVGVGRAFRVGDMGAGHVECNDTLFFDYPQGLVYDELKNTAAGAAADGGRIFMKFNNCRFQDIGQFYAGATGNAPNENFMYSRNAGGYYWFDGCENEDFRDGYNGAINIEGGGLRMNDCRWTLTPTGTGSVIANFFRCNGAMTDLILQDNDLKVTGAPIQMMDLGTNFAPTNLRIEGNSFYSPAAQSAWFSNNPATAIPGFASVRNNQFGPVTVQPIIGNTNPGIIFEGNTFSTAQDPKSNSLRNYGMKGRTEQFAGAAPTTGTWYRGDRTINASPSVGQPKAWTCTVSGTPGTWVSEGNL